MWLRIFTVVLAQGILTQAVTLVARVSVGGIQGTVDFTQVNVGDAVTVEINVTGPNVAQASTWQLRSFRLDYDVSDRCSLSQLGDRSLVSVGGTVNNGVTSVTGPELTGPTSIEGRSLVFLKSDGNPIACATIESTGQYVTARATFTKGILGNVIFRQQATPASSLTRVTSDLYSDGSMSTVDHLKWRVVAGGSCDTVEAAYNPAGVTSTCDSSDHTSCAVGDLTGKLRMVEVGVTKGTTRMTSVDLNLPLSGASSVLEKNVQLFATDQSTPLACATVHVYSMHTGIATFDNKGVTGTITFTQPSPLDPTTTAVNLINLRSFASGYHIHNYPVPQRIYTQQSLCGGNSVSGHFNPFNVIYDANSPGPAVSTEDMYEVGDLSRKYGLLQGVDNKTAIYTDFNLPLFGTNSVLGRSIVIHYDQTGGPRWICTNIRDTAALTSALATFTFPVIGYVLLQQRTGEPYSGTSLYYRLDYGDGTLNATTDHSWAIHLNPVGDNMLSDVSTRCNTTGDVVNPLNVSTTNYSTQCSPAAPLRCELGDLKGKHGAIGVRSTAGTPAIGFYTDVNLPLQGLLSVVGKSLVVKAANGGNQNLACANILRVWPQVAKAQDWEANDYGAITFTQQVGVIQNPTTINIDLQSLSSYPSVSYHVQTKPVATSGNRCTNLGDVYNPFQVTAAGTTKDEIPVGNLTAKFGTIAGTSSSGITEIDPSLDLWGPRSVVGRALTLTAPGSFQVCANIENKMVHGGKLFTAEAEFKGEVEGQILLTQYMYPTGAMTPTTVVVDLRKTNGTQTLQHNWHTHVNVVGNDSMATTGRCSSAGPHYNPFTVNVQESYSECGITNQLRCELGDQSNKLGTYDMGSGPFVATDDFLPLAGKYGVIGRSIVVHMPDRGAPRLACADILPVDISLSLLMSIRNQPTLDRASIVSTIASAIGTETYNVAVQIISGPGTDTKCADIRIYFLGFEAEEHKNTFNGIIGSDASVLQDYMPCISGSDAAVMSSLFLLLVSCVLGRLLV